MYYHYINKEILNNVVSDKRTAYDIDLWGTGSDKFLGKSEFTDKLVGTKVFEVLKIDDINQKIKRDKTIKEKIKELKPGDLIYRKGHVEFYIGNDKVISWGRIHKTYTLSKRFEKGKNDGYFYSNDENDEGIPFTTIIRFIGGENEE